MAVTATATFMGEGRGRVPNVSCGRKRVNRRGRTARSPFRPIMVASEPKPPRGVTLKNVSRLTLLFALMCLGAFLAGRPPAASEARLAQTPNVDRTRTAMRSLRNDDAGRVLPRLRR